jgi:hypothetical protein
MSKFKVVHYINQFFGQVGGEEMAHIPAEKREGARRTRTWLSTKAVQGR